REREPNQRHAEGHDECDDGSDAGGVKGLETSKKNERTKYDAEYDKGQYEREADDQEDRFQGIDPDMCAKPNSGDVGWLGFFGNAVPESFGWGDGRYGRDCLLASR